MEGINELLEQILEYAGMNDVGGIVDDQASTIANDIAETNGITDYQLNETISTIDSDIVNDIAGGIAGGIADREMGILDLCRTPQYRDELFKQLQLAKHPTNYKLYVKPLVYLNWLTMTIPDKPTSPKQQYLTTLKGRLLLEFFKHKTK